MPNQVNTVGATSGNNIQLANVVMDVYSKEVLLAAQPILRFESVAVVQRELMVTPGKTIQFLRYAPLTGKSDIAETATVEAQALSTSTVSVTVSEHVKAVSFTEFLVQSSADDILSQAAIMLGQHYAKDRDRLCRDTLLGASNTIWAKARANRAALTATDYFDVDLVRDACELLATNKAPKINGDAYVCFIHPHQARRLRADSAWINASNYGAPEQIFSGEIGRIEDVRFIQTTHVTYIKKTTQDIWADSADTGDNTAIAIHATVDVYQSIIVGDYALALAEALPVEMRDDGVTDLGRNHKFGYYGIWGTGLIEGGHVAVLETA